MLSPFERKHTASENQIEQIELALGIDDDSQLCQFLRAYIDKDIGARRRIFHGFAFELIVKYFALSHSQST